MKYFYVNNFLLNHHPLVHIKWLMMSIVHLLQNRNILQKLRLINFWHISIKSVYHMITIPRKRNSFNIEKVFKFCSDLGHFKQTENYNAFKLLEKPNNNLCMIQWQLLKCKITQSTLFTSNFALQTLEKIEQKRNNTVKLLMYHSKILI